MKHDPAGVLIFVGAVVFLMVIFLLIFVRITTRIGERTAAKAAEVLKIYAERGQEPPPGVRDALIALVNASVAATTAVSGGSPSKAAGSPVQSAPPPPPDTRARHIAFFARDLVVALGAAGIAWWRSPGPGEPPGGFMTFAVVIALIFAAGAVWHLVTALQMHDEP